MTSIWRWITGAGEDDGIYRIPGQFQYDGLILGRAKNTKHLDAIRHDIQYRSDDILSVGFPKSGQTWINEIAYQILNMDKPKELRKKCDEKWIFIELSMPPFNPGVRKFANSPSPRFVKSHLPARYYERCHGEGAPKIIVPMRNPKDTLVSLYHFYRMNKGLGNYTGTWDEFFELYKIDGLYYENILAYNAAWFERRHQPNVYIVKYEDMHKDTRDGVRNLALFLGRELTDDEVDRVVEITTMSNMSRDQYMKPTMPILDESISNFFRKGKVGDWRNYFSTEQSEYIDNEYEESCKAIGLEFDFTI